MAPPRPGASASPSSPTRQGPASAPRSTASARSTRRPARPSPAWAAERERPLHAHVSEQPAENEACIGAFGSTPTAVLEGAGALGPRFTAVHATHLTERRHRGARHDRLLLLSVPDDRA